MGSQAEVSKSRCQKMERIQSIRKEQICRLMRGVLRRRRGDAGNTAVRTTRTVFWDNLPPFRWNRHHRQMTSDRGAVLLTGGTKQSNPGPARARPDAETAKVDGRCFGHVDRSVGLGVALFFSYFPRSASSKSSADSNAG